MTKYNDELLESHGLTEGLYRDTTTNEVVNLLCVGPDFKDSNKKVAVVRRMGLQSVWIMDVEDFCIEFVRVLGALAVV